MTKTIHTTDKGERLFDRRQILISAGGFLLSMGALGLVGCGGGGFGGGGGGPMVQITGTLGLPAGFGIPIEQLSVIAGVVVNPTVSPNTFKAKISRQSPSFASVQDLSGNGIMFGFLDPTNPSNVIDPLSTAVALLYFMLGSYTLPTAATAQLLSLLALEPSVIALGQVIAVRLAADPRAIVNGDAQISAALQTAYNSIVPAGPGASHQASGGITPANGPAAQLLVQPTGIVSGAEVVELTSPLEIQVTNHYRRRCKVFVYKTGTQPSGGAVTMFTKVESFAGPISLPPTQSLSIFNAIEDLFTGASPFNPVSTAPIKFELDQGATKTFYEVIVLGSSENVEDPSFYTDPRYVDQVPLFRSTRVTLNILSAFVDLLFSIVLEVLGVKQIISNADVVERAALSVAQIQDAEWQNALTLAQQGHFGEALAKQLSRLKNSSLVRQDLYAALAPLLSAAEKAALEAGERGAAGAAYLVAIAALETILAGTTILLSAGDIGAVLHDLIAADTGNLWTATAFIPSFALNPPTASILAGQRVTFSITPPIGYLDGDIEYRWTQNSNLSTFSSSDGLVGNAIITVGSAVTVDLVTAGGDLGTITVKVVAYIRNPDGSKTRLDQATSAVTITPFAPTGTVAVLKYSPLHGQSEFCLLEFATFQLVDGKTEYQIAYEGGANPQSILRQNVIDQGAPVVDQMANNDISTLVPYGGTGRYFNLGGGTVGWLALGNYNDGFSPIGQYQAIYDSETQAMIEFNIVVKST